jgi:hypothetical protein
MSNRTKCIPLVALMMQVDWYNNEYWYDMQPYRHGLNP